MKFSIKKIEKSSGDYELTKITLKVPQQFDAYTYLGVDPGTVNLGLCGMDLDLGTAILYQIKQERDDTAVERIQKMRRLLQSCFTFFKPSIKMMIEGASFGNRYRQVELAEIRAAAVLWGLDHGAEVKVLPPLTIRKQVFGSAKQKPHEVWSELAEFPDAAEAFCCSVLSSIL